MDALHFCLHSSGISKRKKSEDISSDLMQFFKHFIVSAQAVTVAINNSTQPNLFTFVQQRRRLIITAKQTFDSACGLA